MARSAVRAGDANREGRQVDRLAAARALLERLAGDRHELIGLEMLPAQVSDSFEYEASGGRLVLRGSDPIAIARALYDYVTHHLHQQLTWDDPTFETPVSFSEASITRHATGFRTRYHFNSVTSGYSTAFWDWDRWEQEIDWMALHGVTMPLMIVGHEAALIHTYESLGLEAGEAREWIGGAAHFPWTWMGATHSWGGPAVACSGPAMTWSTISCSARKRGCRRRHTRRRSRGRRRVLCDIRSGSSPRVLTSSPTEIIAVMPVGTPD